jgi:hypothetical protein
MDGFNRRQLVCDGVVAVASLGLVSLTGCRTPVGEGRSQSFEPLEEGAHIEVGGSPQRIAQKAYEIGYDLQKKHGGCARCTVAALLEAITSVPSDAALRRAASCLDGGATPRGVQNCGAFTGAGMSIGWLCGTAEFKNPVLARKLLKQVYQQFETQYGSVLCKDVRPKAAGDCPRVVGLAAQWTVEAILTEFTGRKDSSPA